MSRPFYAQHPVLTLFSEIRFKRLNFRDQPVEDIGVRAPVSGSRLSLHALNQARLFERLHVRLDCRWLDADPVSKLLLGWKWRAIRRTKIFEKLN